MSKVAWDRVPRDHAARAIAEYDRLGPEPFFSQHGFGPTHISIDILMRRAQR